MAKKYLDDRTTHLVCVKHMCLFRECGCHVSEHNHKYILANSQELKSFFETGQEINYWEDVVCKDYYDMLKKEQNGV
jgi:hypothetical protein